MQKNALEYLESTVEKYPKKTAFFSWDKQCSFEYIYNAARAIGGVLRRYSREPLLVFMGRGPESPAAYLGVAYSGNIYVPLDADAHKNRLDAVLRALNPKAAICARDSADVLRSRGFAGEIFIYEEIINAAVDAAFLSAVRQKQTDADILYIVFTSGSAGAPKAVAASHRNVISYIDYLTGILNITPETVFGNQVPLYMDASVRDVYTVLKTGASAFLIQNSLFMFPVKLIECLNERRVNTLCWVASALSLVSGGGALNAAKPEYVNTVAFGGEILPPVQLKRWLDALPDARFFNLYGPSEVTGVSCYYEIDRAAPPPGVAPIGRAFPNMDAFLINDGREVTKSGERGVIHLRGAGVTAGYYGGGAATAKAFIQNPLHDSYPETVYNTGDIGAYDENGMLVFIGRDDFQIKRHGFRFELTDIENAACAAPGVTAACCAYDAGAERLWLYYCGGADEKTLAAALNTELPNYMRPSRVIRLDALPRLSGQKTDRALLLKMTRENDNG